MEGRARSDWVGDFRPGRAQIASTIITARRSSNNLPTNADRSILGLRSSQQLRIVFSARQPASTHRRVASTTYILRRLTRDHHRVTKFLHPSGLILFTSTYGTIGSPPPSSIHSKISSGIDFADHKANNSLASMTCLLFASRRANRPSPYVVLCAETINGMAPPVRLSNKHSDQRAYR